MRNTRPKPKYPFKLFRKPISAVAQILLVALLLPCIAILLNALFGQSGANPMKKIVEAALDKTPYLDAWAAMLNTFSQNNVLQELSDSMTLLILKEAPKTMIINVAVYACNGVGDFLDVPGPHILSSFIGVLVGLFSVAMLEKIPGTEAQVFSMIGFLIVMIIGLKILFAKKMSSVSLFSVKRLLSFVVDGLVAVELCAYLTCLMLVMGGYYGNSRQAAHVLFVVAGAAVVVCILSCVVAEGINRDKTAY